MDLPCEPMKYIHLRSWKVAAALSDYLTHLSSTYLQNKWSDKVDPLLEDKRKLARWMEGPFEVLAQIRSLQT